MLTTNVGETTACACKKTTRGMSRVIEAVKLPDINAILKLSSLDVKKCSGTSDATRIGIPDASIAPNKTATMALKQFALNCDTPTNYTSNPRQPEKALPK